MAGQNQFPMWTEARERAIQSYRKAYAEKHDPKRNVEAEMWRDRYERFRRHSVLRFNLRLLTAIGLFLAGLLAGWLF